MRDEDGEEGLRCHTQEFGLHPIGQQLSRREMVVVGSEMTNPQGTWG